jgi:hypothetical protein
MVCCSYVEAPGTTRDRRTHNCIVYSRYRDLQNSHIQTTNARYWRVTWMYRCYINVKHIICYSYIYIILGGPYFHFKFVLTIYSTGDCHCDSVNWAGDLCDECNNTFYGPDCLPLTTVLDISPSAGPDTGETLVHISGHNFPETVNGTYYCRFATTVVMGMWMSRERVTCLSPKHAKGNVVLEISPNDTDYTANRVR